VAAAGGRDGDTGGEPGAPGLPVRLLRQAEMDRVRPSSRIRGVMGARVDGREGTPGSANAVNEPERCRPVPDGAA
jgi:hypothetical protein